jgi:hypothetical protein
MSLDHRALQILERNRAASVQELYDVLKVEIPSLTESEIVDTIWKLAEEGKATLEDIPPTEASFGQYLRFWDRNLRLYGTLAISFATIFIVYAVPARFPFVVLRWVLGSIFVVVIPGFATVEALFPKGTDLDPVERFACSIGLSLFWTTVTGLLLNNTSWGIRLPSIVISLTIITLGLVLAALVRGYFQ